MLTEAEYEALKARVEENRRAAEEKYKKDLEALDRVYRLQKESGRPDEPEKPLSSGDDDTRSAGNAAKAAIGRGDLSKAVRNVLAKLPDKYEFNILHVVAWLKAEGIFAKKASVRPVLARLVEDGLIHLLTQGIGRAPSVYRRKA